MKAGWMKGLSFSLLLGGAALLPLSLAQARDIPAPAMDEPDDAYSLHPCASLLGLQVQKSSNPTAVRRIS